jgi:hypothetical protein
MTYLVQFKRFRRGVPVVVRTIRLESADGAAALAHVQSFLGTRHWPVRVDALRVMDDGGRTLIDWDVPPPMPHPSTYPVAPTKLAAGEPRRAPSTVMSSDERAPMHDVGHHLFAAGQSVSYSDGGGSGSWEGGYEIVRLEGPAGEPHYAIRSADQSYDRIVQQHELREDLGARVRGA